MGKRTAVLTLAAGLFALPACVPLNGWELPSSQSALVSGEVRSVDTRRSRIEVRQEHGRNQVVRYDGRTEVVYRQRRYPVSALERGDLVRVRVASGREAAPLAERIDVQGSARDRGRVSLRTERLDGTVGRVDTRRGTFTLERRRTQTVVVRVPGNLRREDARRLERLRRGERVRLEVLPLDRNIVELIAFR